MPGSVTPYFTVPDADQFIEFLIATFHGILVKQHRYENGRIQHARVQIDESLLMINESNDTYEANASQMHIIVEDADVTYRTALLNGARSIMEPNDRPHGERMAGVTDPVGNTWWIASALPNHSR